MALIGGQIEMAVADGVAVLSLAAAEGEFPWGTKQEEHRWNPVLVGALNSALDAVEELGEECGCLVLKNAGKFWSNGMDLTYLDSASDEENAAHEAATNQLMARGTPTPQRPHPAHRP